MIKSLFNFFISFIGFTLLLPLLIIVYLLIFFEDFNNPLFISLRVGKNGKLFKFYKFRSMRIDNSKNKVFSTSNTDKRLTTIGRVIRQYKIDELPQLLNVIKGDMNIVGPRPNVLEETRMYTDLENNILSAKPGITDLSSIVFSDEGDILSEFSNPNLAYNQLIRPWKSRLCLFYIDNNNLFLDIQIIFLTVLSIINRKKSLKKINHLLTKFNANEKLIEISLRNKKLLPHPPPGKSKIVSNDEILKNYS